MENNQEITTEDINFFDNNAELNKTIYPNAIFDWAEAMIACMLFMLFIFVFVVRIVTVDGDSMLPTLHDKDTLLISSLFYEPSYMDIVVLTKAEFSENPIVKRVIATEGQTVDIDFKTGSVYVDDKILKEDYINELTFLSGDMILPAVVPDGHIFVLGDNRNRSSDSRVASIGMVDEDLVIGKVYFRIFPFDNLGEVE